MARALGRIVNLVLHEHVPHRRAMPGRRGVGVAARRLPLGLSASKVTVLLDPCQTQRRVTFAASEYTKWPQFGHAPRVRSTETTLCCSW